MGLSDCRCKFNHMVMLAAFAFVVWWCFERGGVNPLEQDQHRSGWFWLCICAIVGLFVTIWQFIWDWEGVQDEQREPLIWNDRRDVHLERYAHLNSEITRYRDLTWKIVGFTWGIYYALIRFFEDGVKSIPGSGITMPWFAVLLFMTALAATIFYLFCEVSTEQNRDRRTRLEDKLGLDQKWRHKKRECIKQVAVQSFCFFVFGLAIWVPPLLVLFSRSGSHGKG